MYNPRDIINLIAANVRKSRNPFGIPNSQINTWWREAPGFTRRPGDALLVTGLMYQSIPYIEATTRYLERLEGSRWAEYLRFAPLSHSIPSFLVGRGFALLTSKASVQGRDIIVVDDIVDTGLAISHFVKYVKKRKPASVKTCALLDKPSRRKVEIAIDYVGITIPDKFVVGYGIDCNEEYRHLADICVVEE